MNEAPTKKETNSKQVMLRSFLILTTLIILLGLTFTGSMYAGLKSGQLNQKIVKPLISKINSFNDFLKEINSISEDVSTQSSDSQASSSAEDNVEQASPSPTNVQSRTQYAYPTYVAPKYNYPTYTLHEYPTPTSFNFPTPKPGELGSPEWKAKFDQEFQAAKDAQAKFCKDNPDLCK